MLFDMSIGALNTTLLPKFSAYIGRNGVRLLKECGLSPIDLQFGLIDFRLNSEDYKGFGRW